MLPYAMGAADEIGNGPFQDPCCCRHLAQAGRIFIAGRGTSVGTSGKAPHRRL